MTTFPKKPIHEMERRIRERRAEILAAGDGCDTMPVEEARGIAFSEPLEAIAAQDGDHLAETEPELAEWLGNAIKDTKSRTGRESCKVNCLGHLVRIDVARVEHNQAGGNCPVGPRFAAQSWANFYFFS